MGAARCSEGLDTERVLGLGCAGVEPLVLLVEMVTPVLIEVAVADHRAQQQSAVWTVPPPETDPRDARLELARRYLHIYGPATPEAFGRWAGIGRRHGIAAFEALRTSLTLVHTCRRRMDPHPR